MRQEHIARGTEVGGGDERNEVGTIVSIAVVRPTGQGTFAVGGVGVARVRVRSWLDDTPYPLAELQLFPDPPVLDPTVTRATLSRLVDRATEIRSLVTHGERAHPVAPLGDDEDVGEASFRVAGSIPLGPADRYAVLAAADVDTRLAETARAFDDVEAALRFGQQQ